MALLAVSELSGRVHGTGLGDGCQPWPGRDGDSYVLNGQKTFITDGPHADTIVVYAKLDENDSTPPRDRKVLTFVLDSGMEGVTRGAPFQKMGIHSSPTGELFFSNVRLGKDRLLGEPRGTRAVTAGTAPAPASPSSGWVWRRWR